MLGPTRATYPIHNPFCVLRVRHATECGALGATHPGNDRPSHGGGGTDSVVVMDNRNEVRDFLISRRAKITPDQAGLPAYGGNRRVPGLRREEVALLAGVSIDYYTRLERGNLDGYRKRAGSTRRRAAAR